MLCRRPGHYMQYVCVVSACTSTHVHACMCVSLIVKMYYLSRLSTAKIRVYSVVHMTEWVWRTGKVILTQFYCWSLYHKSLISWPGTEPNLCLTYCCCIMKQQIYYAGANKVWAFCTIFQSPVPSFHLLWHATVRTEKSYCRNWLVRKEHFLSFHS